MFKTYKKHIQQSWSHAKDEMCMYKNNTEAANKKQKKKQPISATQ